MKIWLKALLVCVVCAAQANPGSDKASIAWSQYADTAATVEPAAQFPFQSCFERASATHDVPLTLLLAVARGESDFDPIARSSANAIGIMQILWPGTGRHLGIRHLRDLYDPCTNVMAGAQYLRELIERYDGDLHLAVAAYNYGPSRVSARNVPKQAAWYSNYILGHLQFVTAGQRGTEPSSPRYEPGGKLLVMRFNSPWRAERMLSWLQEALAPSRLAWFRAPLGRHDLVLLYADENELQDGLTALAEIGLVATEKQTLAM